MDGSSLMAYDGDFTVDDSDFLLAETQVQQQQKEQKLQSTLEMHMNVDTFEYHDIDADDDVDDDDDDDDDVICELETLKMANRGNADCHNGSDNGIIDGDGESIHSVPGIDDDQLLEYHSDAAAETVNLLLPELQPTAALDCTSFVDFDEFNLCLNNLLSDDDEFPAEAVIVGTESSGINSRTSVGSGSGGTINVGGTLQMPRSSTHHSWAKVSHTNVDENDLFSMVHLSDDLDLDLHEQQITESTTVTTRAVSAATTSGSATNANNMIDIVDNANNEMEPIDVVIGRSSNSIVNIFQ